MIRRNDNGQEELVCNRCRRTDGEFFFPFYDCWELTEVRREDPPTSIMCDQCVASLTERVDDKTR